MNLVNYGWRVKMNNNIKVAVDALGKILGTHHELYLHKSESDKVIPRLQGMLTKYVDMVDSDSIKDKAGIELIEALVDVLSQQAKLNSKQANANYCASDALRREGLFTPKMMYQLKEDFEAISQLHTKFKAETEYLIEQGQISISRNAELRLENMELSSRVLELEELIEGDKVK